MADSSDIQNFYKGKNVFLTGVTGFVGKVVLEHLLRKCPDIGHVYILIRQKKGKEHNKRLEELLDSPLFDSLKAKDPTFTKKLILLQGDLLLPNLGLTATDQNIIVDNVHVVFHCAATVRFDETLRRATEINVIATRDLLQIAKKMHNLKAFVHVSTAYSNCDRRDVDEIIYKPKLEAEKLIQAVEALNDDLLKALEPRLLDNLPNTYTLTKQIAEDIIKREGQTLPICIVRPSIVIATFEEPVPGFVDNINGASGILLGTGLGILRAIMVKRECKADVVPADFVANQIIASAWDTAEKRLRRDEQDPEVLNCVNGVNNVLSWGELTSWCHEQYTQYATVKALWVQYAFLTSCRYNYIFLHYLFHMLPAYIIDFVCRCIGKPEKLVKTYNKISRAQEAICYFPMREWEFFDRNTRKLLAKMSATDRSLFNIDIKSINWKDFMVVYMKGIRVYTLNDPLSTVPQGRRRLRIMWYITYVMFIVLCAVLYSFCRMVYKFIF